VNAGGWLVLEAWMTPSIFADFNSVASKLFFILSTEKNIKSLLKKIIEED
jgi:hypothetical protein